MKRGGARRQLTFFSISLVVHLSIILLLSLMLLIIPDGGVVAPDRPLIVEMRAGGNEGSGTLETDARERRERPVTEAVSPEPELSTKKAEDAGGTEPAGEGALPSSAPGSDSHSWTGGGNGEGGGVLFDYIRTVRKRIEGHKRYPRGAYTRNEQGTVTVSFLLNARGDLVNASVLESSGHTMLDEAALVTVKNASPYPAFPTGLRRDTLVLRLKIEFKIR